MTFYIYAMLRKAHYVSLKFNSSYLEKNNIKKMKILFIIPYIPFPLNSGGNQAFFNMVDYLRHKMDVSILLQVQYASEAYDISKLKEIWDNVTFFVFTKKDDKQPKVHHPFYYKWLIKTKQSIERKIRRQIIPENIVFTPDLYVKNLHYQLLYSKN